MYNISEKDLKRLGKIAKGKLGEDLSEIHHADKFSIASDSFRVGVVIEKCKAGGDDVFGFRFGDTMDLMTGVVMRGLMEYDIEIQAERTHLKKELNNLYKVVSAKLKEKTGVSIKKKDMVVRLDINLDAHRLQVSMGSDVFGSDCYTTPLSYTHINVGENNTDKKNHIIGVNLFYLLDMLDFFDDSVITFKMPEYPLDPFIVVGDLKIMAICPFRMTNEWSEVKVIC